MLNVARVAIMGCCFLIKMSTFAPLYAEERPFRKRGTLLIINFFLLSKQYESIRNRFHFDSRFV